MIVPKIVNIPTHHGNNIIKIINIEIPIAITIPVHGYPESSGPSSIISESPSISETVNNLIRFINYLLS
jgi:hypothetical protein